MVNTKGRIMKDAKISVRGLSPCVKLFIELLLNGDDVNPGAPSSMEAKPPSVNESKRIRNPNLRPARARR